MGVGCRCSRPRGLGRRGGGGLRGLEAGGAGPAGRGVVCVGFAGHYDDDLPGHCDRFATAGVLRPGRWARLLRRWGASEAVMIGTVSKTNMYHPLRVFRQLPDWRALRLWYRDCRHDRRSQTLLAAVAQELARSGIELIDNTRYIPDHVASAGVMTRRAPTAAQRADIALGWPVLMRMNELEVGQAIAVKDRDIIAVEAMEGTDRMIVRAGELVRGGGWTLLKAADPDKDMRFDVPTVGVQTIENLRAAGARCLAVAAGAVIFAEKPKVIAAADAAGIAVVGLDRESAEPPER